MKHEYIISSNSNYDNKYRNVNSLKVGHSKYISVNTQSRRDSKEKIDKTKECKIKALHMNGHVQNR